MKINIDEAMFNKAIANNNLEVAKFLLDNACPTNYLAYFQNFDATVLDWLNSNGVTLDKHKLHEVINRTKDVTTLTWFIDKGCIVDDKCLNACIKSKNYNMLSWLVETYNVELSVENFKSAIILEDDLLLDYLKKHNCQYNETVVEIAIKNSKKHSIKWLVMNGFF